MKAKAKKNATDRRCECGYDHSHKGLRCPNMALAVIPSPPARTGGPMEAWACSECIPYILNFVAETRSAAPESAFAPAKLEAAWQRVLPLLKAAAAAAGDDGAAHHDERKGARATSQPRERAGLGRRAAAVAKRKR